MDYIVTIKQYFHYKRNHNKLKRLLIIQLYSPPLGTLLHYASIYLSNINA